MNTETQLRGGIAITLLSLITLTFYYLKQSDELKKCQTDKYSLEGGDIEKDSLRTELFIEKTKNGRYEITLEILRERDSSAAQKFEDILYKEAE